MRRTLVMLFLAALMVLTLAGPASAFIHVRVPGDDCGNGFGPDSTTAAAAITSQSRPGNLPPLGDDALHDNAPNNFCPAPNK
jgi:hypothetical protein